MFHECRARIRLLKREGLQFAFLMMLQSSVVRQLLSKLLENTHKHIRTGFHYLEPLFDATVTMWMDRYYDTYLPFLLEACNDENPDVRQVCAIYALVVV
jgi:hypothetical protein